MKEQHSRLTVPLLVLLGALLFAFTSAKAYLISFTHDESQTFLHFVRYDQWWFGEYSSISANNHPLNSLLMITSSKLFGNGELALRLPNVIAHLGYLWFTGLLALRYRNIVLAASAFLLLNVNPFVLDFFSVARGYGISMCFLAGSLWYLSKAVTAEALRLRDAALSMLLALAGVFANFTLLNYMLVLSGVLGLAIIYRAWLLKSRQWIPAMLTVIAIMGFTLRFFIPVVEQMEAAGTLYYGGENGFWRDTVDSLIINSFRKPGTFTFARIFVIATVSVASIIVIAEAVRKNFRRENLMLPASLLLVLVCAAGVIAQHHLMGTRFLLDRTGLFFIPLFMLLVCETLYWLWKQPFLRWVPPVTAAALAAHFIIIMNFKSVVTWEYDAGTKLTIEKLEQEYESMGKKGMITIGTEFTHVPALTYYKATRDLGWLNKPNLQPEYREYMDYLVLPASTPPAPGMQLVDAFPGNNILYRNAVPRNWTPVFSAHQRFEKEDVKNGDFGVISEKFSSSGKSSGVFHPENNSALLIEDTLHESSAGSIVKVHVKAMVLMEDKTSNLQLVVSSQSPENLVFWDAMQARDHVSEEASWVPVNWVYFLQRPVPFNVIKAYFMGSKGSKVYFDDLEVTAYTIKP